MQSHTKKSTRIVIWTIAIVMAFGFLGSYLVIILENNNSTQQAAVDTTPQAPTGTVDPSAFKVDGPVVALQKTDERVGTGAAARVGDTITVHYKGTIAQTGVKFDSSYDSGEPVSFPLQAPTPEQSGVIQGWVDGLEGMKVGGKRRLVIPAVLAYGDRDQSSVGIPANSDLVFEVELLGVTPAGQ